MIRAALIGFASLAVSFDASSLTLLPGDIVAIKPAAFETSIVRVDPNTGAEEVLAVVERAFDSYNDIAVEPRGSVLVGTERSLFRIDLGSGTHSLLASAPRYSATQFAYDCGYQDVAVSGSGRIFAKCGAGLPDSVLFEVAPDDGALREVTRLGNETGAGAIAVDEDATSVVLTAPNEFQSGVVQVDSQSGATRHLTAIGTGGITFAGTELFVSNSKDSVGSGPGVYRVDPASGAWVLLSAGSLGSLEFDPTTGGLLATVGGGGFVRIDRETGAQIGSVPGSGQYSNFAVITHEGIFSIPEPGSLSLIGVGIGALGIFERRRMSRVA